MSLNSKYSGQKKAVPFRFGNQQGTAKENKMANSTDKQHNMQPIPTQNQLFFYENHGFKFFRCGKSKRPVNSGSWRTDPLPIEKAAELARQGVYIGAMVPGGILCLDIDMGRKVNGKKVITPGDTGYERFHAWCIENNIDPEIVNKTFAVETPSGGRHLFFAMPPDFDTSIELMQRLLFDNSCIDAKPPGKGYVIAAGSPGYTIKTNVDPIECPVPILEALTEGKKERKAKRASAHEATLQAMLEECSPQAKVSKACKVLESILNDDAMKVTEFEGNDPWQKFITAAIATFGDSAEITSRLERWSAGDPAYTQDNSSRKRIHSFVRDGGITPGTLFHILKQKKVKKAVVKLLAEHLGLKDKGSDFPIPWVVNYNAREELLGRVFWKGSDRAATTLIAEACAGKVYYLKIEKLFWYNDKETQLWNSLNEIVDHIAEIIYVTMRPYYLEQRQIVFDMYPDIPQDTNFEARQEGAAKDSNDLEDWKSRMRKIKKNWTTLCDSLEQSGFCRNISARLKDFKGFVQSSAVDRYNIEWDGPELANTLTLRDGVLDFSSQEKTPKAKTRPGTLKEYRRAIVDLCVSDFKNVKQPVYYQELMAQYFPNEDTRRTAEQLLSLMISGSGRYRVFQLWTGLGANGKSALIQIMKKIIGTRAINYDADALIVKKRLEDSGGNTPAIAEFHEKKALVGFDQEMSADQMLSSRKIKRLAGCDNVSACAKYKDPVNFRFSAPLVLATNDLPKIDGLDEALLKRMVNLPFCGKVYKTEEEKAANEESGVKHHIPYKDLEDILKKVEAEKAAILWHLANVYMNIGDDLYISEECKKELKKYIEQNSDTKNFIVDNFEYGTNEKSKPWKLPNTDMRLFYNAKNEKHLTIGGIQQLLIKVFPLATTYKSGTIRGLKGVRIKPGSLDRNIFIRNGSSLLASEDNYTPEELRDLYINKQEGQNDTQPKGGSR